ncbi:hypothetical protein [Robiginitalea biformata]|uniref:Uncharacterized protein n=1 Tax=Robiginitalea biformata (strain ATCC BAA-864 / DSM 15991 / KCTC 12146 / HTCC2501) TaxID=313596 RepID=A4CKM0_ROBBH|nr:hypothetical protein [Robiginitalea biformata]EAR15419.1 hypothetical protein RB2501_13864 [Robiginitalea biformata HTCC2501]
MEKLDDEIKAEEQAVLIRAIIPMITQLDTDFCRQAAERFMSQASRQEAIAALNPSHPLIKNEILRAKGVALEHLCDYVKKLKRIDELEKQCSGDRETLREIQALFM